MSTNKLHNVPDTIRYWCQKILPLVYDDSLSYYELLGKVIDYTNNVIVDVAELERVVDEHGTTLGQVKRDITVLESELNKVKNGDYVSLYLDSIIKWIDNNLIELVSRIVKFVSFGLTNDGYFVAYIPDTWKFITFDTIMDSSNENYGHLVLTW